MSVPEQGIGIDIGGTKMALALVNRQGAMLQREVIPTQAELGFAPAVNRLVQTISTLVAEAGNVPLAGIGIGCAGPVDPQSGLINNPYTLTGWDRCDIVTPLRERFGVPVCLENDADAAAFGECACGAGRGYDPVVMLTFGTGIGGAAIVKGEIYRGVHGEHPELGHIPIAVDGPECYCGTRGCLESIASGTAIAVAGKSLGLADARAVFTGAAEGRRDAKAILDRAVQAAAAAAWTICHTLLPQRLVLGGGIMDDHFDLFAREMRQRLGTATQFSNEEVTIARAVLGNNAGVIGAGMLALQLRKEPESKISGGLSGASAKR